MSTSLMKRKRIASYLGPSDGYRKGYGFVFSDRIEDWILGTDSASVAQKKKFRAKQQNNTDNHYI